MRSLRGLSVALATSVLACGIGSDIDDYAGGDAPKGSGAAGASAAGAAGKPSGGAAGAAGGKAGAGQAGAAGAGQAGAAGAGQAGAAGAGQAGAGQAGAAGAKAGSGGASAGGAQAGAAGAGQAGASAGGGGAPTGPIGQACSPSDTYACLGAAKSVVLKCIGGTWQNAITCADGKLCDSSLGSTVGDRCAPIVPECAGQASGAVVCKGADRITCGTDLVTSTKQTCGSAALCALGKGSSCAECEPGTFACNGAQLSKCSAALTLEPFKTCASAAQCNAASGACTSAVCVAGTFACSGPTLQRCNMSGTAYDTVSDCTGKVCDPVGGQCDACVASSSRCVDGASVGSCSVDGQSEKVTPCTGQTPHCVGAGQCVECKTASDCPATTQACVTRACNSGVCGLAPMPAGSTAKDLTGNCRAPTCDGQGAQKLDPTDVPADDGDFCTKPACTPDPEFVPDNEGKICGVQSTCTLGQCVCAPKAKDEACFSTVDNAPIICGAASDGCGKSYDCGTCAFGRKCCPGGTACSDLSGMCLAL